MNDEKERKKPIKLRKSMKEWIFTLGVGLLLTIVAFQVFGDTSNTDMSVSSQSEKERKVSLLLQQIDGVGESDVMICETEEGVQSVVVVCDGANNLQVVLTIREAVATALGTNQAAVKIYLKKE